MKRAIKVEIFGRDYILKADADDGHIKRVAEFVDCKMKDVSLSGNSKSDVTVAILAAVNIADEYLRIRDERERAEAKARQLSLFLDSSI